MNLETRISELNLEDLLQVSERRLPLTNSPKASSIFETACDDLSSNILHTPYKLFKAFPLLEGEGDNVEAPSIGRRFPPR